LNGDDNDYCVGWKGSPCAKIEKYIRQTYTAWKHTSGKYLYTTADHKVLSARIVLVYAFYDD